MSGAPYGGRFGDPAALRALASDARRCAAKAGTLASTRSVTTDFEPRKFKGPLIDRWKTDGKKAARKINNHAVELRSIATFLEDAADRAEDAIRLQRQRDEVARLLARQRERSRDD